MVTVRKSLDAVLRTLMTKILKGMEEFPDHKVYHPERSTIEKMFGCCYLQGSRDFGRARGIARELLGNPIYARAKTELEEAAKLFGAMACVAGACECVPLRTDLMPENIQDMASDLFEDIEMIPVLADAFNDYGSEDLAATLRTAWSDLNA